RRQRGEGRDQDRDIPEPAATEEGLLEASHSLGQSGPQHQEMSIAHGASIMRTQGRIRGFTLLEVMVAMLLAVIIMVTVHFALYGVLYARDTIDEELAGVEVGPTILDLIERDLMALHVYNVEGNRILHGVSQSLGGHDADQIDFLADVNSSVTRSK